MYAYVDDNPTSVNDPSGLDWVTVGNCSYDTRTINDYVWSGTNADRPSQPTGSFTYIAEKVGQCGGIADGDLPAPLIVPDTTFQYRISNTMLVPAEQAAISSSNGTAWYKNTCIQKALGKGALEVGLDSIGLIPEAGGVARILGHQAGYVGVVADHFGANIVDAVGHTAGAAQGLNGLTDTSPTGLLSTGFTVASFIPGPNDVAAVGSIGLDIFKTLEAIRQCP